MVEPVFIRRVEDVLDAGDLLTANEYLQRLEEGQDLPDPVEPYRDVFKEFFPDRANDIERRMAERESSPKSWIRAIRDSGQFLELGLDGVSRPQRSSAERMLDAWFKLKRGNRATLIS